MDTQLINALHQELIKLYEKQDKLEAKYDPGFGLHKTRVKSAQKDKTQWLALQRAINTFDSMLMYYGYAVSGPKRNLVKEQ
jgi:hypothetical protein